MRGKGVEFGAAGEDAFQRDLVVGGKPVWPGHDPADGLPDGLPDGRRDRAGWRGGTTVTEAAQVAADRLDGSVVAHTCDLLGEAGGVGDALVPAAVEMFLVRVDLAGSLR
ncbi:hypothetical protein AB1484_04535 [Parafrankia sp. FMc6]|uniref:hypothetical protein n=1 Tax=Parafrankia soli TaxID=2599596 RepID=UPI0034D4EC1F